MTAPEPLPADVRATLADIRDTDQTGDMDLTLGMFIAAAAALVAVVALIRVIALLRAKRRATRDDLQRAGAAQDADAQAAADRAAGHNSWMRPDGGGTTL